jgi:hypothetical protein
MLELGAAGARDATEAGIEKIGTPTVREVGEGRITSVGDVVSERRHHTCEASDRSARLRRHRDVSPCLPTRSGPGARSDGNSRTEFGSEPGSASDVVVFPTPSGLCFNAKAVAIRSSVSISARSASSPWISLVYLASTAARRPLSSSFASSRSVEVRFQMAAARNSRVQTSPIGHQPG